MGTAAVAAFALFAAACSTDQVGAPANNSAKPTVARPAFATGAQGQPEHVVVLKSTARADFQQAIQAAGGTIEQRLPAIRVVTVSGLTPAAVTAIAARTDVAKVVPDLSVQWIPSPDQFVTQTAALPDGFVPPSVNGTDQSGAFFFNTYQWNMRVIQAPAAWASTPGGSGALVCVLDTGVDPDHLDLAGKVDLTKSTSFVPTEPFIEDLHFHGTHVSSNISSNGIGIASVAPDAKLCAVKVLGASGSGSFGGILSGIIYATDQGADVINMSLGAYIDTSDPNAKELVGALTRAVAYARAHGVVVVASAGNAAIDLDNDNPAFLSVPAQINGVVSVAATGPFAQTDFDALASYSNFGKKSVTIGAPGGDFLSGDIRDFVLGACSEFSLLAPCAGGNHYIFVVGTSQAAPHVSGAAAVVESDLGIHGGTVGTTIAGCLKKSADHVKSFKFYGAGRVNVFKAANAVGC